MTNLISKIFGQVANLRFGPFQSFINKSYVKHFKIDMSEFAPYQSYINLNELFTRRLIKPRKISDDKSAFLSPSDGLCFECGTSVDLNALSIKGHNYSIDEFLGAAINEDDYCKNESHDSRIEKVNLQNNTEKNSQNGLIYANIYLSPKDYHHYHAPCDIEVLSAFYTPAKLYSVARKYLAKIPNLYCQNERVILRCKMANGGILWLGFVGALNVGKMKFDFDPTIQTNAKNLEKTEYKYQNIFIKKGERIGNFELGSTIVIIAQSSHLRLDLKSDEVVKFAGRIGELL